VSEHEAMCVVMLMSAAILTLFIWTTVLTKWLVRQAAPLLVANYIGCPKNDIDIGQRIAGPFRPMRRSGDRAHTIMKSEIERGRRARRHTMKALWCLCASVPLLELAPKASADIVTMTATGTVAPYQFDGGYFIAPVVDYTGIFGQPGDNLAGDPFIILWTVNTNCAACNGVGGGPNGPSPIVSAVLTINGGSVTYGPGITGFMTGFNNGNISAFHVDVMVSPGDAAVNSYVNSTTNNLPNSITQPFSYTLNVSNGFSPNFIGGGFSWPAPPICLPLCPH
jgi:hypothetical protein